MNKSRIDRLIKERILEIDDCESLPTCESCLLGKMTKLLFKKTGESANNVLGLIYTDVCGSMSTSARRGYYYFITFIETYRDMGMSIL